MRWCGRARGFVTGVLRAVVPIVLVGLVAGACGSADTAGNTSAGTANDPVRGTVTVFAAASLTAAFTEIATTYQEAHRNSTVTFNFAGSSELARQIGEGAPGDVFAAADQRTMAKLTVAGNVAGAPVVFATNRAQIIVAPGNPLGVTSVSDLSRADVKVVQCAAEVPCGAYTAKVYELAGVTVTPKSLEQNVKAVVSKVTLGEADAGIVYVTDVLAAGDKAAGVAIPDQFNVVVEYPIAVTAQASNAAAGQAFVDVVRSAAGREILTRHGFQVP